MTQELEAPPHPDAYAKVVGGAGRFLARHPQPLLARACVQLLMRAPGRELEVRDRSGNLQRVDTRDQMGANLLVGRYRLPADVVARIRPGDWVIDIGANIGVITSQLCATVGAAGRVWAFEPVPANVTRLAFLKERNGLPQLEVFPVAVGAGEGSVAMGMPPPGRSGWGSVTKSWDVETRFEVPVRPLDALVASAAGIGAPLRFVKIDVEGFEPEVVEGAAGVLRDHRPMVFCEFNDVLLRDRGRSSAELLSLFGDLGYHPADEVAAAEHMSNRVVNLLLSPTTIPTGGST